jgi:putative spermidine/putrescine transport system ATP-binding protein
MRDEIRNIQQRVGITTVFVTHDQEEALAIADRIGVMHNGILEQLATPDDLYTQPATLFVASFIGSMNLLSGIIQHGSISCGSLRFSIPYQASISPADEVVVAIRPEHFTLQSNGPFSGIVRQTINLGDHKLLVIDSSQVMLHIAVTREQAVPPGTVVHFTTQQHHVYQGGLLRGSASRQEQLQLS